jgi:N-acetylmuramoyl-L-alanine amidase
VSSGGEVEYETLLGRPWDKTGAHTKGENHDSLGICFVGNYDFIVPPAEMLRKGAEVVALWLELFELAVADVYRHHDFNPHKTCPGKTFDLDRFKFLVGRCLQEN